MKYKFFQQHRMLQKFALTPQMRQSIQLLALPVKELLEYIDSLLEKNPFLKKEFDRKPSAAVKHELSDLHERLTVRKEDPRRMLLSQIRMTKLSAGELEIAEHLIYGLDDNGYITEGCEEISEALGVDVDMVENVIRAIHRMDPPGIGARNPKECLQIQLKRSGREKTLEYAIVSGFLNEAASNDVKKIARSLNIVEDEAARAIKNIIKLNPRPASTMLAKEADPVIPDLVANVKEKKVSLGMNREWLPRLKMYNPYQNQPDIIKDPQVREFIKENMQMAKGLLDNLKRREETLCKVTDYILNFQRQNILDGKFEVKSLTIKDVANALNMHPSTISRTVSNKYIQIKDKVIPVNSFLSKGMKKPGGGVISKSAVKNRLAELVSCEEKKHPLSDEVLKAILEKEDVRIGRRTIAKYRESLRILPSHLRKKF